MSTLSLLFPLLEKIEAMTPFEIQQQFSLEKRPENSMFSFTYDAYFAQEYMGYVSIHYADFSPTLQWQDFFPLSHAQYLTYENSGYWNTEQQPRSYGIGTLAHVETLLAVLAEDENVRYGLIQSTTPVKPGRAAQLNAMDLSVHPTPFREYLNKSLDYAVRKGFDY